MEYAGHGDGDGDWVCGFDGELRGQNGEVVVAGVWWYLKGSEWLWDTCFD